MDELKVKELKYDVKTETAVITAENIAKALQVLVDNGIEESEAGVVLQAIGYTLIDTELDCDGCKFDEECEYLYRIDGDTKYILY